MEEVRFNTCAVGSNIKDDVLYLAVLKAQVLEVIKFFNEVDEAHVAIDLKRQGVLIQTPPGHEMIILNLSPRCYKWIEFNEKEIVMQARPHGIDQVLSFPYAAIETIFAKNQRSRFVSFNSFEQVTLETEQKKETKKPALSVVK